MSSIIPQINQIPWDMSVSGLTSEQGVAFDANPNFHGNADDLHEMGLGREQKCQRKDANLARCQAPRRVPKVLAGATGASSLKPGATCRSGWRYRAGSPAWRLR